MENNIVIAKFKKWNFLSKIPLILGILYTIVAILIFLEEEEDLALLVVLLVPAVLLICVAFIIKNYYKKLTLTITDKWIFSKRWFGKKTSIPMEKVSYISTGVFKRISIHSDGGKITLWGCKNDDEIFGAITSRINL